VVPGRVEQEWSTDGDWDLFLPKQHLLLLLQEIEYWTQKNTDLNGKDISGVLNHLALKQ